MIMYVVDLKKAAIMTEKNEWPVASRKSLPLGRVQRKTVGLKLRS